MRIAICDDNKEFLFRIQALVASWQSAPEGLTADTYEDGDSLINIHRVSPYDIILLDVLMPLLNGIQTAKEIRETDKTVKIVFLTSSPEYAVDSYRVKASDYLLKPIEPQALYSCLDEIIRDLNKTSATIAVKGINSIHRVELETIEYAEAQNKRVLLVLSNGRTITSTEPLYVFEQKLQLNDGFFKCSRSYIVNIHHIDTYKLKEIQMRSGCRISISRNLQREFESAYFSVIFGRAGDSE